MRGQLPNLSQEERRDLKEALTSVQREKKEKEKANRFEEAYHSSARKHAEFVDNYIKCCQRAVKIGKRGSRLA